MCGDAAFTEDVPTVNGWRKSKPHIHRPTLHVDYRGSFKNRLTGKTRRAIHNDNLPSADYYPLLGNALSMRLVILNQKRLFIYAISDQHCPKLHEVLERRILKYARY